MFDYLNLSAENIMNIEINMKSKAKRSCPLYGGQLAFGLG
ncbi:hypothetical protein Ferpe_0308 [Fervidobacterium pennivorans DSM 9078]|uniref:Uncharacterized protein n=1 Tax=Fervidobacterium pennivorans (strain DSM 9078 / Ven5) TaxID=771875 RepID=H9UAA6_FERPD|nr:hypothetical protein Ferpe_0308 [Fervidobacterium pennivorans DSM 9078]